MKNTRGANSDEKENGLGKVGNGSFEAANPLTYLYRPYIIYYLLMFHLQSFCENNMPKRQAQVEELYSFILDSTLIFTP